MSELSGTPGAQCALHVDQRAQSICARCGSFMCNTCTEGGTQDACPACREVTGAAAFPYDRDNYSLDGVLSFSWDHFKREWLMLSVAIIVYFVVLVGVSVVSQILQTIGTAVDPIVGVGMAIPGQVLQTIVQMILTAGLGLIFWEVFRGHTVDIGRLFRPFSRFGTFVVAAFINMGILLAAATVLAIPAGVGYLIGQENGAIAGLVIGLLLMIVPLVWVTIPLTFVPFEVAIGGETSAVQAVKNAYRIVEGRRWSTIGFMIISGLITMAGVIACCVGMVPAAALAQMLTFGLYLALRNGSGLAPAQGA
jgi:hypothetical protein